MPPDDIELPEGEPIELPEVLEPEACDRDLLDGDLVDCDELEPDMPADGIVDDDDEGAVEEGIVDDGAEVLVPGCESIDPPVIVPEDEPDMPPALVDPAPPVVPPVCASRIAGDTASAVATRSLYITLSNLFSVMTSKRLATQVVPNPAFDRAGLATGAAASDGSEMDIDALLHHYFGTDDPDSIPPLRLAAGRERLSIDFGLERDPGRRFALWTLLDVFGTAPLPAEAFAKEPELRRAADDYLSAAWKLEDE